jgi:hypothetical protein
LREQLPWQNPCMEDPAQRERESQESTEDKFHELTDEESEERARRADRVKQEGELEEREED